MKRLIKLTSWVASLMLALLILTAASAQGSPPIKISLVASKTAYGPDEHIKMQVRVLNDPNDSTGDVITRKGFQEENFHLRIRFTDPDGNLIRTLFLEGGPEPGPPYKCLDSDGALVEIVSPTWDRTIVMDDARVYYDLAKFGRYTAEVFVPLETFSQSDADPISGGRCAYLTDRDQVFNPVASNKISFEILPAETLGISSIQVEVGKMMVGGGATPETKKSTPEGIQVHLIQSSKIPTDFQPVGHKTYPTIWAMDCFCSTVTDSNGVAKFEKVPQDNYEVIAYYPKAKRLYVGGNIRANDTDWFTNLPVDVRLRFMEKADGTKVPGKTTKLKGSELLITEPEYVEWDSTEELYPFVFESVGDWGVTTSVAPPEGFVADNESLAAEVTNETEAVQFTITDVGSKWEETEVTYEVKHKGKTKKIKKKIGVKLSEELAKQKGVGVYGHTPSPGPFKGGKKLGHKKDLESE